MKNLIIFSLALFTISFVSCKKDDGSGSSSSSVENYSSVNDFLSKNQPKIQEYIINASLGGTFTSPQGTKVTIPANAFLTQLNTPVTGNVTIQFKDIYRKSDMLFADMPTMIEFTQPLKSGGEFFIKAISNNSGLLLANGKKIVVEQPAALTGGIDTANAMLPFIQLDTMFMNIGWFPSIQDSVTSTVNYYIYSLYQFSTPADSGTWCNSDNSTFFSMYPQTDLTLIPNDDINLYGTQVFLVFKDISSMIHVYQNYPLYNFKYDYSPVGLECTVVTVGVKDGKLFSSFTPITISNNQTLNFSLNPISVAEFKNKLNALN